MYIREYRTPLTDFYREHMQMIVRVTTEIQISDDDAAQNANKVLSKNEIFDVMVQKNPVLGQLRDALNLQIDY